MLSDDVICLSAMQLNNTNFAGVGDSYKEKFNRMSHSGIGNLFDTASMKPVSGDSCDNIRR